MEMIFVENYYYYKEYYLSTGRGAKKLFKLPFMYQDMEYCALIEDNRVVIYKVPSKLEELGLKASFDENVMNIEKHKPIAKTIIPEGIISKIDIGPMAVTFSLDQSSSIFGLPTGSNTITMGQTAEGLVYAICSTDMGNDLYFFTYNEKNNTSEWVKTEENALNIEVLNSFAYKVTTKDKQRVVNFATHHISPFKTDVTVKSLNTLEASSIDIIHSFVYDEGKDWTNLGKKLYCYYRLNNGNKTTIQVFSRHIYDKEDNYALQTIYNGNLDDVQYVTNIKRSSSNPDERIEINAICGFKNGDLAFAYPIMLLDGNIVRTNNKVNILGSLGIESPYISFLSYRGNEKRSFHIYDQHCKNGDRRIECSESKKHNELGIIPDTNEHIILGINHNESEASYSLYYCDNGHDKVLVADAYRMDKLDNDGYIFYTQEDNKTLVRVLSKQGIILLSDTIDDISNLKLKYDSQSHLLILQFAPNNIAFVSMKDNITHPVFFYIKEYRVVDAKRFFVNGQYVEGILYAYVIGDPNSKLIDYKDDNQQEKGVLFTLDGKSYPYDLANDKILSSNHVNVVPAKIDQHEDEGFATAGHKLVMHHSLDKK